jgi:hypothetical protein
VPEAVEPGAFAPDDLRPEEIPREEERPGSAGGSLSPGIRLSLGIRPVSRQACPTTCLIATRRIAAFHVATGHVTTRRVQPGVQQQAEQFRFLICVWSRDRVDASGKDVTVVGSVHRRKGL